MFSFVIHRKPSFQTTLAEAEKRLYHLCTNQFSSIAKELQDFDQYQYGRAYSAGLQEFIEAYTYYEYVKGDVEDTLTWDKLQKQLTYSAKNDKPPADNTTTETSLGDDEKLSVDGTVETIPKEFYCLVQPIEFMLGLADIGGEIMRRCINSLGNGDVETCFKICQYMQLLYSG